MPIASSYIYLISGHIFHLIGIFLAFLAAGIAVVYATLLRGGATGKSAMLNAIGFAILATNIFLVYAGATTGELDLLNVTIFWPLLGLLTLIGFVILAYAQYATLKVIRK